MSDQTKSTEETLQLYANPVLIQNKVLDAFERYISGGKRVLDGNNVFTFLLEMHANMAANITDEMISNFRALYPVRAEKNQDLYRHMSDYEYVGLFSTPATTTIELMLDRDYIINNAKPISKNSNYGLVVIPSFSTFKIGTYTFGIFYPIQIRVFKKTNNNNDALFQITWDTSVPNPLYTLDNNMLEHRIYRRNDVNLLCISIPVHQFETKTYVDDIVPSTGFIKRYIYKDKFYACRVFVNNTISKTWEEISTTLSDVIYDPELITAKVSVLTDISSVEISLPQVYLSSGITSNKIMTIIYTDKGAVDIDIQNYHVDQFSASFLINDKVENETYSGCLKRIPLMTVLPLTSRIQGGSNGLTYDQLRSKVLYDLSSQVLITPEDISSYLAMYDFNVEKYIDNITNRIYIARKILTDTNKNIVPSGDIPTRFDYKSIQDTSTIRQIDEHNYMILPTTIYRYNEDTQCMHALTDKERAYIDSLSVAQQVDYYNKGTYTFSPFHVKLSANPELPIAGSYDLLKPKIMNITFDSENENIPAQISMYSSTITHLDNGTGGYRVAVSLYKSSLFEKIESITERDYNIRVVLVATNKAGVKTYTLGECTKQIDGRDVFVFDILTNYNIKTDNTFEVMNFTSFDYDSSMMSSLQLNNFKLTTDFELRFYIKESAIPDNLKVDSNNRPINLYQYATNMQPLKMAHENMVWLSTQKLSIKFGEPIPFLMNNLSLNFTGIKYATWPTTKFATYSNTLYARTKQNAIKVTTDDPAHIYAELDALFERTNQDILYVFNIPSNTGTWYERVVTSELIDEEVVEVIEWLVLDVPVNQEICYSHNALKYSTDNNKVNVEVAHNAGDIILSATDTGLPVRSQCFDIKENILDETKLISKTHTLYLHSPYTALPKPTNIWGLHPSNTVNKNTDYTVKTIDLMKLIIDVVKTTKDDSTLPLTIEDMLLTNSYDPETGDPILVDSLADVPFVYIEESEADIYSVQPPTAIIKPSDIPEQYYVMTQDIIQGDDIPSRTVYRRDDELMNYDYKEHISTSDLIRFWNAVVENNNNISQDIVDSFNLNADVANTLWKMRFPWKKEIAIEPISGHSGCEALTIYWDHRYILNMPVDTLMSMQRRVLEPIDTYATADLLPDPSTLEDIVWCDDISGLTDAELLYAIPLLRDIATNATQTIGAILKRHMPVDGADETTWEAVVTGPSKEICINDILSYNTYSGYVYVVLDNTPFVSEIVTRIKNQYNITVTDTSLSFLKYLTPQQWSSGIVQYMFNKYGIAFDIDTILSYAATIDNVKILASTIVQQMRLDAVLDHIKYINIPTADKRTITTNETSTYTYLPGYNHITCNWDYIGKWPWELSNWMNKSGKYISAFGVTMDINTVDTDTVIIHKQGDVLVDQYGKLVEAKEDEETSRNVIYNVNMIHCSYPLSLSNELQYENYRDNITELIRSHMTSLSTIKHKLLEQTEIYFAPIRTIGYGNFKSTNDEIRRLPVNITIDLRVHTSEYIEGDGLNPAVVENTILEIVKNNLSSGKLSTTKLANEIRVSLGDVIQYVDVLGINGDADLQTLLAADKECIPQLAIYLKINDDGTIGTKYGLNITWSILR